MTARACIGSIYRECEGSMENAAFSYAKKEKEKIYNNHINNLTKGQTLIITKN